MVGYRYTVIICPKCGRPKISDLAVKTTRCPSCGKNMIMKKMRHYGEADSPQGLIPIIGKLNQRQSNIYSIMWEGEISEIEEEDEKARIIREGDIAAELKRAPKDRMSRLRQGMLELGEFTVEDFTTLFVSCGGAKEKAVDALGGFLSSGEVFSPRRGFFRYVQ